MKKVFAVLTIVCMLTSITLPTFAQTITEDAMGISFILSDDWRFNEREDAEDFKAVVYVHKDSGNEGVMITAEPMENAYGLDLLGDISGEAEEENFWEAYCKSSLSDEYIAENLSSANYVDVSVKAESTLEKYETIAGTLYYKFEKAYTASAPGFYDQGFYDAIYITAKNGFLYKIRYSRDDDAGQNHFPDIYAMLASMSYAEGETKIVIDNETISPDTAPMIIGGRTLVPIRAVAEKMGYTVEWDEETQTVTMTGKHQLSFTILNRTAVKNGVEFEIDIPAVLYNSRTYLPLRAVTEAMDATVDWSEEENTVFVKSAN
ncbi:MAG: copper amine oxidase N-terminal domain-containing protein [Clostridia bacterium]|nr:copper amine oxidase N-terminal domain-containing protein [Clostridia bacterium]